MLYAPLVGIFSSHMAVLTMTDISSLDESSGRIEIVEQLAADLKNRPRTKYAAQSIFVFIAHFLKLPLHSRNYLSVLKEVKCYVEDLIVAGYLNFHYEKGDRSWYEVTDHNKESVPRYRLPGEGRFFLDPEHLTSSSIHAKAGQLLARRIFVVNKDHLSQLKSETYLGKVFDNEVFRDGNSFSEEKYLEKLNFQKRILKELEDLDQTSFDVKTDDRGRFYFFGGIISPHAGRLTRWLYKQENELTLDHRASFAQITSLLYGNREMGKLCGLGSLSREDFYLSILKKSGLNVSKDSIERKIVKQIIMPMAYGESFENAKEKAYDLAMEYGVSENTLKLILDACKDYVGFFKKLIFDTRNFSKSFTDWGDHPAWRTPSGFDACKKYLCTKKVTWNTGEGAEIYYPISMTFHLKTKMLSDNSESSTNVKKAYIATTANIIQSLDAALLARSIVTFYQRTKEIPFTVHDSYTVSRDNAKVLEEVVCDEMRKLLNDPDMKKLRKLLRIPAGRIQHMDLTLMNPLSEE